ncbi:hypothetical protein EDD94_4551 [Streptomyces sp. PanSC9]|nr:hypothetical protein EDD94_4551 [Streptomyces sp. PanSC9]
MCQHLAAGTANRARPPSRPAPRPLRSGGARLAEPPSVRTGGRAPAEHAGARIRRADPGRRSRPPTERACARIRRPASEGSAWQPPAARPGDRARPLSGPAPVSAVPLRRAARPSATRRPAGSPPAARPARHPPLGRRAGRQVPLDAVLARPPPPPVPDPPGRPVFGFPFPRRRVRRQAPERGRLPPTATLGGQEGLPTHDSAARGRGVSRALSTRARRNSPARRYALRLPGPGARHRGARTRRGGRAGRAGPGPTRPGDVVASGPRPEAQ